MKKRVIIYTRVSTDEQKLKGFSLPEQKLSLTRLCEKNEWEIVGHYEEDHSAKDFKRPAFQRMLKDIKSKSVKADYFLCVKADRFSRNLRDSLNTTQLLNDMEIEVKFLEGDFDLSIPENILPYVLNFASAQMENERLSIRTKRGMRQAKRSGKWVGTSPKGYKSEVINDIKTLIPNEDAPLIIEAFEEFAKGIYSTEQLRKILLKKGLKVSENQFPNILRNPVYCGKIRIESWRDEPEEIIIGNHEPLITEELFDKVQRVLSGTSKFNKPHKSLEPTLPLRGFLKCNCGRNLTGSFSKSRNGSYHPYYHCQNGCSFRIPATIANTTFEKFIEKFSFSEDIIKLYTKVLEDAYKKYSKEDTKKLKDKENEFQQTKVLLETVQDKFISGQIDVDTFNSIKSRYEGKIKDLKGHIHDSEEAQRNFTKFLRGTTLLCNLAKRYSEGSVEFKVNLLGSIFKEKLEFHEESYRTGELNEVLKLFLLNYNDLCRIENKKAIISDGFTLQAPPLGLEPRTP